MGLRSRIKRVLFGRSGAGVSRHPTSTAVQPTVPTTPTKPPTTNPVDTTGPSSTQVTPSTQETELDPKVAKHRRRTICALLSLTIEEGGTASLGDLHDLSERRYFIAHKAFSDLMEEMVQMGIFTFNWETQEATITEQGQAYLNEHDTKKPKKKS